MPPNYLVIMSNCYVFSHPCFPMEKESLIISLEGVVTHPDRMSKLPLDTVYKQTYVFLT